MECWLELAGTLSSSTTTEPLKEETSSEVTDRCAGCQTPIQPSSLAIRVRQLLFHVNCVRCNSCGVLLKKGDFFGVNEESLYCYMHYYPQYTGARNSEPDKVKRTRTSFKHDQLLIMRHHFNINQRPKSPELRMIAQKTGLDKKTLQVSSSQKMYPRILLSYLMFQYWFQNTRRTCRRRGLDV